jgi:rRNA processing protein Gar1
LNHLGTIEDISYRGMLIVRPPFVPRTGAKVVDRRSRTIGRIVGLVGPVSKPFVLIEPLGDGGKGAGMVGMAVYLG